MSHAAVRRVALVSFAVSIFLLLVLMLIASVLFPQHTMTIAVNQNIPVADVVKTEATEHIRLPMQIACTSLIAQSMASYDGPFYEDGSGEEVINVAALVLHNSSDMLIPYASVVVETQTCRYFFQAHMIPPHASVLIPELSAQPYCKGDIVNIFGWHTAKEPESSPGIKITEQGEMSLQVKNVSGCEIRDLTIYFRNYVVPGNVYTGGKAFEIKISHIPPGKSVILCPKYYICGYSHIMYYE